MSSHVCRIVESSVLVWVAQILKIRGGKSAPKVDLIDMNAECQLGHVEVNARRSRVEPNLTMMECNSSTGRSAQPWSPNMTHIMEMGVLEIRLMLCMVSNSA
jgi:hypothetical protein